MAAVKDCLFCKIIKGEIPCNKVYEDKDTIAFLDIHPINKGHALVLPKKHSETILDTDVKQLEKVMAIVKKIAGVVVKTVKADGFEICINNKKAAGQVVPHLHVHIIPRFNNDGLMYDWATKEYKGNEAKEIAGKIKNLL